MKWLNNLKDDDTEINWNSVQKKYEKILKRVGELTKNEKNENNVINIRHIIIIFTSIEIFFLLSNKSYIVFF